MNYHVYDNEGELVRRFYTKQEAAYWVSLRPECVVRFNRQPKLNPWDKVAELPEAPF